MKQYDVYWLLCDAIQYNPRPTRVTAIDTENPMDPDVGEDKAKELVALKTPHDPEDIHVDRVVEVDA